MEENAGRADGPMVLPRAFSLLRLLANEAQGLNLSEVATRLNVPKSSLSTTLRGLVEQQYLTRKGPLYYLGSQAYSLASAILAGRTIRQIARPFMEQTLKDCGETVLLAVLDSDLQNATYIDFLESEKSVRFAVNIGTRRPLFACAAGRLLLAYQSADARKVYYKKADLIKQNDEKIIDSEKIESIVKQVRRTGVSISIGDYSADAAGFSSPIYNSQGEVIAALVIGVPVSRGKRERRSLSQIVKSAAHSISEVLGYKGGE